MTQTGKCACHQGWWPEFDIHGRREKVTQAGYPLTFTSVIWHKMTAQWVCAHTGSLSHTYMMNLRCLWHYSPMLHYKVSPQPGFWTQHSYCTCSTARHVSRCCQKHLSSDCRLAFPIIWTDKAFNSGKNIMV